MSATARQVIAVIPARYGSTRFPGKALANKTGKPLIQHVVEQTAQCERIGRIIVATDDERIRKAVESFGCEVMMTRGDHENGTSRIAEVSVGLTAPIIVNVQGDEPSIEPGLIEAAIVALERNLNAPMATIASPFAAHDDPNDPNIVKVVFARNGTALYFSRSPIPCWRDAARQRADDPAARPPSVPLKHVGLYVYRREFLATFLGLSPSPLELTEQLEQLRVLEHGYPIAIAIGEAPFHGIDTPEQYDAWLAERAKRVSSKGRVESRKKAAPPKAPGRRKAPSR